MLKKKDENNTDIHNYYTMDFWFSLCLYTLILPQHQLSYKHDCVVHNTLKEGSFSSTQK